MNRDPTSQTRKSLLQRLGPGLIAGASRNDPSSMATYARVGAQTGFTLLWTLLFSYPLLGVVQDISARIGRVTGRGIAGNVRIHYPRWVLFCMVSLLLIVNTINLAADIGVMGESVRLLIGGPAIVYSAVLVVFALAVQIFTSYDKYATALKWLTLALLAYVATAFVVQVPWGEALRSTLLPSIAFSSRFLTALIAVFGATINPYVFFWQAAQEVEEQENERGEEPLRRAPGQADEQIHRIKVDTYSGMAYSNIIAFFIMLTAAVTLHDRGITDIGTAAQAAEALRPVAGDFAFLLFSIGIIGTGLLALPVLAGSAAYAVGGALNWPASLDAEPRHAKGFYGVIAAAMIGGLLLNLAHINVIQALFWTAVLNGIVVTPMMAVMMLMTTNPRVMGRFTLSRRLRLLGWLATAVMLLASVGLFVSWV